jgi:hypothetical protein
VETVQGAKRKQSLQGIVKSDKMDKTIVVEITMRKLHPLYKKYVTKSKSIKAHDERTKPTRAIPSGWSSAGPSRAKRGGCWLKSSSGRNKAEVK